MDSSGLRAYEWDTIYLLEESLMEALKLRQGTIPRNGFSFSMSRGGPGLVFALFCACIFIYSISNKSSSSIEQSSPSQLAQAKYELEIQTQTLRAEANHIQKQDEEMRRHFKMSHS